MSSPQLFRDKSVSPTGNCALVILFHQSGKTLAPHDERVAVGKADTDVPKDFEGYPAHSFGSEQPKWDCVDPVSYTHLTLPTIYSV